MLNNSHPFYWRLSLLLIPLNVSHAAAEGEGILQFFQAEAGVVQAASKHTQTALRAPANSYLITATEIQRYGYRTLAEALQSVPGLFATDDRNYTYLWIRGFGRPGDYNTRILFLLNGHRLNENVYGSVYPGHEFNVDIKTIDRIEVIKGPGSALYGDSAFFAVINIIPKTAQRIPVVQANVEGGHYGTVKGYVDFSKSSSEESDLYASGSYRRMSGQDLYYPEFNAINNGVAVDADGEQSYTFYSRLALDGFSLQGNYAGRTKQVPTGAFGTVFNNNGTKTTDSRSFVELQIEHPVAETVSVNGRAYYDWYDYHGDYMTPNTAPPPDTVINKDFGKADWYGEETRIRFQTGSPSSILTLGQEFEQNKNSQQLNYDEDPYQLWVHTQHQHYRWAFFIQEEWTPVPQLSLTMGGRYDRYEAFGHTANPRLAAVYQPREQSAFKVMYGTAFRAPTLYEMFFEGSGFKRNPDLQPEKIRTYEVQWIEQTRLPFRGDFSLSYFHNDLEHLINEVTDPADDLIQFQNTQRVRSQGLEASARWECEGGLSGRVGYLLQKTRDTNDVRLSQSPEHTGSLGLSYGWSKTTFLSLETFFVGSRRTVQNTDLPATALLSLNGSAQPWFRGPRFYAGIFNLLNTDYHVSGAEEHSQAAVRQNGINVLVGMEYRLGSSTP